MSTVGMQPVHDMYHCQRDSFNYYNTYPVCRQVQALLLIVFTYNFAFHLTYSDFYTIYNIEI